MRYISFVQSLVIWLLLVFLGISFRQLFSLYLSERGIILGLNYIGLVVGLQSIVVLGRWRSLHAR